MKSAIIVLFVAAFVVMAGYKATHYDIDGFCPMAIDSIRLDHGRAGYEKAEASWRKFSDYYHCGGNAP